MEAVPSAPRDQAAGDTDATYPSLRAPLDLADIDWVICGGESGPKARPMHPEWAAEIRDACLATYPRPTDAAWVTHGTRFFFKQWGEWAPKGVGGMHPNDICLSEDGTWYAAGKDYVCFPNESDGAHMRRVGKRNAGRELDGRTWSEYPPV